MHNQMLDFMNFDQLSIIIDDCSNTSYKPEMNEDLQDLLENERHICLFFQNYVRKKKKIIDLAISV